MEVGVTVDKDLIDYIKNRFNTTIQTDDEMEDKIIQVILALMHVVSNTLSVMSADCGQFLMQFHGD